MEPNLHARVRVPESVVFRELDGEAVLLDLDSERYFGLDAVGTRMWACLTTCESLGAACDALILEYDVEPERLERDLLDLVGQLVEQGLLEFGDA